MNWIEKLDYYITHYVTKKPKNKIRFEICEKTSEGVECVRMSEVYRNFDYELGKVPVPKQGKKVVYKKFNKELGGYLVYLTYRNPSGKYLEVELIPPPPDKPKTILIFSCSFPRSG